MQVQVQNVFHIIVYFNIVYFNMFGSNVEKCWEDLKWQKIVL